MIRYVPPPKVESIADQILAIHAEGFRSRLAQAQAAADEQFQAGQAEYAQRAAFARERLKAANEEAQKARDAIANLDVKDAEGRANALKTIASLQMTSAHLASLGPGKPEGVLEDPFRDEFSKQLEGYPTLNQVFPPKDKLSKEEKADRATWTQARQQVGESGDPSLDRVFAVMYLDGKGASLNQGMDDLRRAVVREYVAAHPLQTPEQLTQTLSAGVPVLLKNGLTLGYNVVNSIRGFQDVATKGGDNPAEAVKYGKKGGGGGNPSAKAQTAAELLQHPEQFQPDYSQPKADAQDRLARATADANSVELPDAPLMADRIERTRNEYAGHFGPARTTEAPHPIDPLLDALEQGRELPAPTKTPRPITYEMDATERAAAARGDLPPVAATEDMSRAAPPPESRTRQEPKPAPAAASPATPPAASPPSQEAPKRPEAEWLDRLDYHGDEAPVMDLDTPDSPELTIEAKYAPLLEEHGLAGAGGVRKLKAQRLAANTAEGRMAKAAIDGAKGGDPVAAIEALKDPRAKAIAAALAA